MRKWKIHLIHHTHFDIGYTHTQQEVLDIQFRNQEQAMDLIDANRDRPSAAQFRWNPEATWALKEWLNQASKSQIERFRAMVRSGHIGLDGLFANMHTALCRPEELSWMMDGKRQLEELTGMHINSAMITDVPGWNWGMVSALSEEGIRYLSAGTNVFDRIGYTVKEWGDKPFYWVSPSGKEKILLWVHGKGYSWFHTGLNKTTNLRNKLRPGRIRRYLNSLERSGYPYDILVLRYNIGSDNGPPDNNLSSIVEKWNERHSDMQLEISTNAVAMADFENGYGAEIPEYRGDFTAYWEDGALSTARETAVAREASERLIQADTLAAMTGRQPESALVVKAREEVLLFNEHTWGAYNSISRPDHPFAKSQWDWKRQRALNAEADSKDLLHSTAGQTGNENTLTIYNTHSWKVSGVVEISTNYSRVLDSSNKPVPSQRLSNGWLAVLSSDVPPLGSLSYKLEEGETFTNVEGCYINDCEMGNGRISCVIDKDTGRVGSIIFNGFEYVDNRDEGFNAFVLVPGKFPVFRKYEETGASVSIEIMENGPLRSAIRIKRKAPRCNEFITEISINLNSDAIYITNILERPVSRRKEGIHFAFPMDIPDGELRYDSAWGTVQLETDQLPGANRNFISASRMVDISGPGRGMACVLIDAPIFKSGNLTRDPFRTGPPKPWGWKQKAEYNGVFYSYVMNNYWQTNFKADQPGRTVFRYAFRPYGKYIAEQSSHFTLEKMQPLIPVSGEGSPVRSLPQPGDERIALTSAVVIDDGLRIRLVNISDGAADTTLSLAGTVLSEQEFSVAGYGKTDCKKGNRIMLVPGETVVIDIKL